MTYRHDHLWWFDADDAPETWQIAADVLDDSGTHVEDHVGDITIVIVDVHHTRDLFSLLDGEDADLGLIGEVICGAGTAGVDPALDRLLEPGGSRILVLTGVRLANDWRGFGLGALLAGTAIAKLSGGARAAVCYSVPLDESDDEEQDQDDQEAKATGRQRAIAALDRVWAGLGFEHFRDGVHVLDLNLVTLQENLRQLRKNAEAYRSFDG